MFPLRSINLIKIKILDPFNFLWSPFSFFEFLNPKSNSKRRKLFTIVEDSTISMLVINAYLDGVRSLVCILTPTFHLMYLSIWDMDFLSS